MGIGSALAIGALALLGIGGAILVAQLIRRRDSVQASAEKAISDGLRGAFGDLVNRVLPKSPAQLPGLPQGAGARGAAGELGQVTGVLQGIGGIAQGVGGLIGSISNIANLFGSSGGAASSGSLAGGVQGVLAGGSPASFLDRDTGVIDFGPSSGGPSNVDNVVVD